MMSDQFAKGQMANKRIKNSVSIANEEIQIKRTKYSGPINQKVIFK